LARGSLSLRIQASISALPLWLSRLRALRTAPDALGFFTGDYEGLTSAGGVFEPFVVLANSGNLANRTDVFATRVHAPFGASAASAAPAQTIAGAAAQRTPGQTPTKAAQARH